MQTSATIRDSMVGTNGYNLANGSGAVCVESFHTEAAVKNVYIATGRARLALLAIVAAMTAPAAHAVDGAFDPSWGNGGHLQINVSAGSDVGKMLLIQPDGKLLMAGTCYLPPNTQTFCATRLLATGSYDTTFGPANHPGRVVLSESNLPDGQLVAASLTAGGGSVFVGNSFTTPTMPFAVIVKLDAAGSLVSSSADIFDPYFINALAVQPNGRIVVVGGRTGSSGMVVRRYLENLADDLVFGEAGTKEVALVNSVGEAIAIQADSKIVVAGQDGTGKTAVVRLTANGQLDDDPVLGFGDAQSGIAIFGEVVSVAAIKIDRDGSLLLAGNVHGATGPVPSDDFFVNRLTPNGQQDPNFGLLCPPPDCAPGPAYIDFGGDNDYAQAMAVQSDGKILVSGNRNSFARYFSVARLTRYGDPDASFGAGGNTQDYYGAAALSDTASAIAIGNGGLIVAGFSREAAGINDRFGIAKLQLDLIFTDGVE